ncbi:hypothetical protein OHC33_005410 [Knufia fluminis]|uniref:DUF4048 domain-containing protein n=2 Tax=Knufia TaxID=430999 RepID=A0AAN8I7L9_9EURO|nr:hypothetical protein OHC33_005410 [Knufia fluminis]
MATATATATIEDSSTRPTLDNDQLEDLPSTFKRSSTAHATPTGFGHRHKHSKKLSLNFPILVPVAHDVSLASTQSLSSLNQSPTASSPYRVGTPVSARPLSSPEEIQDGTSSPDFLTLVASQERKVMELKEELLKAESELTGLKKQWAMFEAKKKHAELRNKTVRLGPISPASACSAEDDEAERLRRREARERKVKELGMKEGEVFKAEANSGKRNGGRVFAGRHTRTLSLLQNNAVMTEVSQSSNRPKSKTESSPFAQQQPSNAGSAASTPFEEIENMDSRNARPSLSRQPTLQELIANSATGAAQMNFGKTYKDLAHASRKSLPPGTDVFVKQGKQVYDGVSQGFWNFVEDIRQATVGDEPVTGVPSEHRREIQRRKSNKKLGEHTCDKHGRQGPRKGKNGDEHKPEKDNFWKEFGIETPKPAKQVDATASKKAASRESRTATSVKDHESKSSTDSKCPPSLLADLMDVNEDDEAWDSWPAESPMAQRHAERRVKIRSASDDGDNDADSTNSRSESRSKNHGPMEASWVELTT